MQEKNIIAHDANIITAGIAMGIGSRRNVSFQKSSHHVHLYSQEDQRWKNVRQHESFMRRS